MTHDGFLRAILDRPDDDVPRLVYADWLEEHGDPARAEFIRVQCELATLPDDDPRRPTLEDREHGLLVAHEPAWLTDFAALDGHPSIPEWAFRRGFLDEVCAGTVDLDSFAHEFFARRPVRRWRYAGTAAEDYVDPWGTDHDPWIAALTAVDLSAGGWATDDYVPFLCRDVLPHLRDLDLSNNRGIGRLAVVLEQVTADPGLVSLAFGGRSGVGFRWADAGNETIDVAGVNQALAHSHLEDLTAFDCGLTSDGLSWLLAAPWGDTLRSLDVSDNPVAPDAWRAFRSARCRLDRLDVSGTPLAGISLEPLLDAPSLERLTRLEMNRCGSARRNMEVLAGSRFWTQAEQLRAHSGTIPASTLEPLCQANGPPRLLLLDLADNYLRTRGVRMLCEAPWAGSLTWLALSRNYLDDDALVALAVCGRFTKLRTLHLAHNNTDQERSEGEQITDRGVAGLASAPSLSSLRVLSLSYTGVTDRSVDVTLNAPYWRLFGLGLAGCDLSPLAVEALASSPRLARLSWLDLGFNPRLSGTALRPLAASPYLSRLCELDVRGVYLDTATRQALRARLGPRLSD